MTTTAAASSSSSSSWWSVCELSGEPLSSSASESSSTVVVTPSGHICLQRFLTLKLSDNGSVDPFTGAPLQLEDCIVLKPPKQTPSSSSAASSPSTKSSSFTQSLQQLQRDYDAVLLELFDTRQVLHSTRKELSQALYQQDAALRVIARLIQEKEQNSTSHGTTTTTEAVSSSSKKRARIEVDHHEESMPTTTTKTPPPTPTAPTPTAPAATTTSTSLPRIPTDDLNVMHTAWLQLSKSRKSIVQQAAKQVVSTLSSFALSSSSKLSASNTSLSSVVAAKAWESQYQVVVGTSTKSSSSSSSSLQMVVWNETKSVEQPPIVVELPKTILGSSVIIDLQPPHVVLVAPSKKKELWLGLYNLTTKTLASTTVPPPEEAQDAGATLTQVQLHPSGQHVMLTYSTGLVTLYRLEPNNNNNDQQVTLVRLSHWQPFVATTPYTSSHMISALHPDGYLHAITKNSATEAPVIYLYEFKEHNVALTLRLAPEAANTATSTLSTITALAFSPNGYYVALAVWQQQQQDDDKSEGTAKLTLWDLRKSTIVHTLTLPSSTTSSEYPTTSRPVVQLTFDPSGKSLAYALDNGTVGCTNFKNKTTLNEPVLLYLPNKKTTTTTPSSLSWPLAHRIVVTYQTTLSSDAKPKTSKNDSDMEEEDDDEDDDNNKAEQVICVLEAPSKAN